MKLGNFGDKSTQKSDIEKAKEILNYIKWGFESRLKPTNYIY